MELDTPIETPIVVSEAANIKKLFIDMINQTVADFLFGNPLAQVEALEFLTSEDFILFADAVNGELDVNVILADPNKIRQAFKQSERKAI